MTPGQPRGGAISFLADKPWTLLRLAEFARHAMRFNGFADGPRYDCGLGYGTLPDGRSVLCELDGAEERKAFTALESVASVGGT